MKTHRKIAEQRDLFHSEQMMFRIDHLMVEVDDPFEVANDVSEKLGLPFAWPLTEKEEYTSVGVNFGSINIEFINFRVRFGIDDTTFKGFSGIAFKTTKSLDESIDILTSGKLCYRIGEQCGAHTTIPVEEKQVFPTVFIVKYHFDTCGWEQRLSEEFAKCLGGKFNIGKFKSISIANSIGANLKDMFGIAVGNKNQIFFESTTSERTIISDLIPNLEIVIA
ncbi:hypothetical protein [Vibrio diazotrophicus]|uniref:hypothetical protein n=1 Tax=Vibrio diazotrophicus TaxID=685 RepID=UPI001CA47937|nr:hypothetical protein [Vibrio diazotrophicus]